MPKANQKVLKYANKTKPLPDRVRRPWKYGLEGQESIKK